MARCPRPTAALASRRIPALLATLAVLLTLVVAGGPTAGADTRADRDKVRRQRADLAAQLNVLKAQDADVAKALTAIQSELAAQQADVASAEQGVVAAQATLVSAQAAERALTAHFNDLEKSLKTVAIDTYVNRDTSSAPDLDSVTDLSQIARQQALSDLVTTSVANVADQLKATREDLVQARKTAEQAAQDARQRQADAKTKLADLAAAQSRQADFASKLDDRIETGLSEAAGLAQLDASLSAKLAQEQAALVRLQSRSSSRASSATAAPRTSATVPLRTVGGITVNASIADQVAALLAAAAADGITLGGSGYRDPAGQTALREQNCPDPANSSPSACQPPTARPGFSMHEQGLAIDFTYAGAVISSRSSPGFLWLAANAARFGLHNLPSEPWHWSTTGD
jgi:LAS superfamily LD-carboxypeptidase LdcB